MSEITLVPNSKQEHDTGAERDDAAIAKSYLLAEQLVVHLRGVVDGVRVDVAQSKSFEARTAVALSDISGKLDMVIGTLSTLATGLLDTNQRVIDLELWRKRHERDCIIHGANMATGE